jgi:hypothetical protein
MKLAFTFFAHRGLKPRPGQLWVRDAALEQLKRGEKLININGVYAAQHRLKYVCESSLELFDKVSRYKKIRTLYGIFVTWNWRAFSRGWFLACIERKWDIKLDGTSNVATPHILIDTERLQDLNEANLEYLEEIAQGCWDLAVTLQQNGRIQSYEDAYPNGTHNPFA